MEPDSAEPSLATHEETIFLSGLPKGVLTSETLRTALEDLVGTEVEILNKRIEIIKTEGMKDYAVITLEERSELDQVRILCVHVSL